MGEGALKSLQKTVRDQEIQVGIQSEDDVGNWELDN